MSVESMLLPGERLDEVNFRVRLIQKTAGLAYGTDALLLAAYVRREKGARGVELGGGSGIVSLLCLARDKIARAECVEIQPAYAELIARNAAVNGMTDRLSVCAGDVREYAVAGIDRGQADIVFTNPPYFSVGGAPNRAPEKNTARHEEFGGIADFCAAGARALRYGGRFVCVFRPERIADLVCSLRENRLEPKRMTLVHAHPGARPSLLLMEAVAGGSPGLRITRPLFLYPSENDRSYTADMEQVMQEGSLPQCTE